MTNLDKLNFKWEEVGSVPPQDLVDAREQLHHSVQLIAAAGKSLIPERADDSHTSMLWNEKERSFEGEAIGKMPSLRVGLHPAEMTLYIKQSNIDKPTTYILLGNTLNTALSWLKSEFEGRGEDVSYISRKMHYEIPPHAVGEGQSIRSENPAQFKEIGRYFDNANNILNAIKSTLPETGDIRCWPHHFDIATLITIDKDKPVQEARSLGIGLSPGDSAYKESYFYITPWPYPDLKSNLPVLLAGKWHTEGWVGAVLLASEIISQNNQSKTVSDFIISGISACAGLLNHKLG
jgi:hypothetical protein